MWEHCLTTIENDPLKLDREVDWVIKHNLIERYRERDDLPLSHPRVALLDLQYHDVNRDRGIFYKMQARGLVERMCDDADIDEAMDDAAADHPGPAARRVHPPGQGAQARLHGRLGAPQAQRPGPAHGPVQGPVQVPRRAGREAHRLALTWPPSTSRAPAQPDQHPAGHHPAAHRRGAARAGPGLPRGQAELPAGLRARQGRPARDGRSRWCSSRSRGSTRPSRATASTASRYYLPIPGFEPDELAALHLARHAVRLDGLDADRRALEARRGGAGPAASEPRARRGAFASLPADPNLAAAVPACAERRPATFTYNDEVRRSTRTASATSGATGT